MPNLSIKTLPCNYLLNMYEIWFKHAPHPHPNTASIYVRRVDINENEYITAIFKTQGHSPRFVLPTQYNENLLCTETLGQLFFDTVKSYWHIKIILFKIYVKRSMRKLIYFNDVIFHMGHYDCSTAWPKRLTGVVSERQPLLTCRTFQYLLLKNKPP